MHHPALASLLQQVLAANDIAVQVSEEAGTWYVELLDDNQSLAAKALVQQVLDNPNDRRWQAMAWTKGTPVNVARGSGKPLFSGWLASMGWVTKTVLLVTVLIYFSPMLMGTAVYNALLFAPSLTALFAEPWRLFTPMLIHFSALHIIFNLLWWTELGRVIERYQSSMQLLWVTLVVAGISNLAQFLHTGANFGGLSGVVYGLLGYLWIYGRVNPQAGYGLRREIVIFMLIWLVICFVGLPDVVANTAHLAGLLSGCLLGALVGLWRRASA